MRGNGRSHTHVGQRELEGTSLHGTGSRALRPFVAGWRVTPARSGRAAHIVGLTPAPALPQPWPLSPRQAVWLLLRRCKRLKPVQQVMRARLLAAAQEVRKALTLREEF